MNKSVVQAIAVCLLLVVANLDSVAAEHGVTDNVVLVTIDGLRWQDLFTGADERLINRENDGAHDGRYDQYLDAAYRSDQYIQQLWEACQQLDDYRGKTTFVITTDHGRGDDRDGWKSHGASIPGSEYIWIAVIGPDTKSLGGRPNVNVTQSQIAATVAALLGEDFVAADDRIARPLPGFVGGGE